MASIKQNVHIFPESGRVVISHCLGVTKSFKQRVGELDDILDMISPVPAPGDLGDLVHDELGGHGLASPALPGDDDALVLEVGGEAPVHVVRQGVHVGRILVGSLNISQLG